MWQMRAVVFAAALILVPLGARGADLVVWWDEGYYPAETKAATDVVAAFEQHSGKQVELVLVPPEDMPGKIEAALASGKPPDFAFGILLPERLGPWAFDDRLADLSDAIGSFSNMFDPELLRQAVRLNSRTGQKALYGLPFGQTSDYLHVWTSLLEQAGFTLEDIPRQWDAFWSFWCDRVQPAVREATGRDDIWAIGLPMGPAIDASTQFLEFVTAYDADYVTRGGELVIDDPEIRRRLIQVVNNYAAIYRDGCTPPDSLSWDNYGNNAAFLEQRVVMTLNSTLSIPNALKRERPDDYDKNTATIDWPLGVTGEPFPIVSVINPAMVFKDGGNLATAKEFVRFLVGEGWLAHYLNFSDERLLPAMPGLLDEPFWLDPRDKHRMAAAMQMASHGPMYNYAAVSGNSRHDMIMQEAVWIRGVQRVLTDGISPERAVDEAIARIKQVLAE
jgi:multiple sugar transport system substrate-binding protein